MVPPPMPPPPGLVPPIPGMMPGQPPVALPGYPVKPPREPPCKEPNKTLYVNNLNEKIKLEDMKKALVTLFQNYGKVLEVYARGSLQMRGQAFVAFDDKEAATKALKEVHGFVLFGKPILIQYARNRSDVVIKDEGGNLEKHIQTRKEEKEKRDKELEEKAKKQAEVEGNEPEIPNNILFLENIPTEAQEDGSVDKAFGEFDGLKEIRKVPGKPSIAFVEYETELQAIAVKSTLGTLWQLKEDYDPVRITFAKK
ncbi:hypothetical protein H4219_000880 [Mycoemilia scoparia]|uniref:RRM domain-containing protein n=1 Tax=Mycoemilia scoparia TaxID=417184 RepID=A0A9W8A2D5_9FUNG|nr:hypothetical protein H4219_000880 [Mycoemilia scoparia]